jgi:pimeloyl-ACP methyl ester carboxylesterase
MAGVDAEDPDRGGEVTYVLVHGAWHGGWVWERVAALLRGAGHAVHAPTLAGHDLEAHVQQLVGLLEALSDVVLVGHSYGGMVTTAAADRVPQRIRRLVYLDAFVPEDGKCVLDYVLPERAARFREEGSRTGSITPPPLSVWGIERPEQVELVKPLERPQPFACMAEPLRLRSQAALQRIPKTFIYCSSPATGSFDHFAARLRHDPDWEYRELATGHAAMLLVPELTSQVLLEQAASRT